MKNLILIVLSIFLLNSLVEAQKVPSGINYQAIARDTKGKFIPDRTISLRLRLLGDETNSKQFYTETHQVKTNALGLFNLIIGQGTVINGDFDKIPWSENEILMETAIDPNGGTDFTILNTSKLLAVPYAFHANTAGAFTGYDIQDEVAQKGSRAMCPVTYCPCAGGYIQLKLYFFGENNVKIEVYHDYSLRTKIAEFQNVKSKTLLTLNATNLPNGIFNNEIYLKVTNQSDVSCITRIKTVCPDNLWPGSWEDMEILGKTFKNSYGSFTVYSHTDKVNNYDCIIDEVNTDWHVGGNIVNKESNRIGTRTYEDLVFISNDSVRLTITKDGDLLTADGKKLIVSGNLEVQGDSVIVKKDLFVSGVSQFKSNVADGKFVATFENTNGGDGDGIKIKLGKIAARNYTQTDIVNQKLKDFIHYGLDPDGLANLRKLIEGDYNNAPPGNSAAIKYFIQKGFEGLASAANAKAITSTAIELINNFSEVLVDELIKQLNAKMPGIEEQVLLSEKEIYGGKDNIHVGLNVLNHFDFPKLTIPQISTPKLNLPPIPTFDIPDIPRGYFGDGLKFFSVGLKLDDINFNSLNSENTFIQFTDNTNWQMGAIKAQSLEEWATSYLNEVYFFELLNAFSGLDKTKIIPELKSQANVLAEAYLSIGVVYSSGNGDYAEWLERIDPNEAISTGDIVAVKGGKITKDLTNAEQVMAVSHHPIVLGNIPPDGKTHLGNNIAFMGQIPVKIMGPVLSGDFIVAKSGIPGYGVAVTQADMTVDDFKLTVGRAWETNVNSGPKLINTVIGVHNGDYLNILKRYEQKFKDSEARLESVEAKINILSEMMTVQRKSN